MNPDTPQTQKFESFYFVPDNIDELNSIAIIKNDLCLVSSVVSYDDPYETIYQYMIEENSYI